MAQQVKLRRSSVAGNKPTTSQLELGELAINTNDGKLYFEKSSSLGESVQEIIVTDAWNTGSVNISGSVTISGSINATSFTGSLFGTASYATQALSASWAPNTTFPYTGSAIISGSLNVIGATNFSNSSTTVTGSFLVSGSTTQIGNNTLAGNTTLSGSIIISGSTTSPSTPTIKVYGDMETNGVIKFLPVVKNIDTSISGSYIFVSGSTDDLYFSQNGGGYANITRLRWLEGNLYTGLLNGGIISSASSTVYQISSGSGIIVDLNASFNNDPYPTIQYLNWPTLTASIAPFTSSYQQCFVGIDDTGNIYAQGTPFYDGQYDTLISIGNVLFQNQSTINGFKTQPAVAYGFEQQQDVFNRAFGPLKLSGLTLFPSASSTGSLIVTSGTAYSPGANYINDPNNPSYVIDNGTTVSKIFRYYDSGSTWVYGTNGGAGYTTIDPTRYSLNGVLTAVPGTGANKKWTIQRAFWYPNSVTKAIVVYYGNTPYPTETDAIANIPYETFVEAPNTAANAVYLGAIVVRNDAVFTDTDTFKIQAGGLFRQVGGSGGGGSVVTQTLAGLSDVDITGPTDHQPLAYDTTAAKWTNQSTISASIVGNATTATNATSASYATTSSYATNTISASYALNTISASYAATSSYADNFTVAGTLTAQTLIVQTVTSSIIYSSGSNQFGDSTSDTQLLYGTTKITGSLQVTGSTSLLGSLNVIGNTTITGSVAISGSISNPGPDPSRSNEIFGANAYPLLTSPARNSTVMGAFALGSSTGVRDSVAIGYAAMYLTTGAVTGSIAIGNSALYNQQSGSYNIAIGVNAMQGAAGIANVGDRNLAIGTSALLRNTTGTRNNALGDSSLSNNSVGNYNTANGNRALQANTSGSYNVGVGYDALFSQTSASNNTAIGTQALRDVTTGANNVAIGYDSGRGIITGQYNTILGANVTGLAAGLSNNIIIADSQGNIRAQHDASTWSFRTSTTITGSLEVSNGITGSVFGTSSYATQALSSSFATTAISASYFSGSVSNAISSSYATTASFATTAISASYFSGSVSNAISSSYAVTASYALLAVTASYFSGSLSAPGSTTQVLYNNGGVVAGASGLVYNSGNVGIGVTNPGYKLDVQSGSVNFRYDQPSTTSYTYFRNWASGGSVALLLGTNTDDDTSAEIGLSNNVLYLQAYGDPGSSIQFGTRNSSTSAVRMTINQDGNVGIGTTNPGYKLDVNGIIFSNNQIKVITSSGGVSGYFTDAVNSTLQIKHASGQLQFLNGSNIAWLKEDGSGAVTFSSNVTANSLIVSSSLIVNQNTASLGSGAQTISTNATSSYTAAFFNYTVASGSNARAGQVTAVWNGGSIQYTDVSTTDIGSTLAVAFTASLSGANVLLTTVLPTSGWTVKTLANLI